jgi:hypothetical protein
MIDAAVKSNPALVTASSYSGGGLVEKRITK